MPSFNDLNFKYDGDRVDASWYNDLLLAGKDAAAPAPAITSAPAANIRKIDPYINGVFTIADNTDIVILGKCTSASTTRQKWNANKAILRLPTARNSIPDGHSITFICTQDYSFINKFNISSILARYCRLSEPDIMQDTSIIKKPGYISQPSLSNNTPCILFAPWKPFPGTASNRFLSIVGTTLNHPTYKNLFSLRDTNGGHLLTVANNWAGIATNVASFLTLECLPAQCNIGIYLPSATEALHYLWREGQVITVTKFNSTWNVTGVNSIPIERGLPISNLTNLRAVEVGETSVATKNKRIASIIVNNDHAIIKCTTLLTPTVNATVSTALATAIDISSIVQPIFHNHISNKVTHENFLSIPSPIEGEISVASFSSTGRNSQTSQNYILNKLFGFARSDVASGIDYRGGPTLDGGKITHFCVYGSGMIGSAQLTASSGNSASNSISLRSGSTVQIAIEFKLPIDKEYR